MATNPSANTSPFSQSPILYDVAEFALSGVNTNYDVKANQAGLFANVPNAKHVSIRTDQVITVKLNDTSYGSITVNPNTTFDQDFELHHLYITTSAATTNIKIILT